jgi:hypothetical protein
LEEEDARRHRHRHRRLRRRRRKQIRLSRRLAVTRYAEHGNRVGSVELA